MKIALIVILTIVAALLGMKANHWRKELDRAKENVIFYERRSEDLQRDLIHLNRVYEQKVQFLNEIKQNVSELESKVDLKTLQRHVPKRTWSEIEPIIDRLRNLKENN